MANEVKVSTARRKTGSKTETDKAATKPVKKTTAGNKAGTSKAVTAKAQDKPATAKKAKPSGTLPITPETRLRHIEMAAYYIAEKRGFSGGDAAEDWLAAERQIDHLLMAGKLPT